jgi:hypothetical protein
VNQRWYDFEPNMSLAVSLLHNSRTDNKDLALSYFNKRLLNDHGHFENFNPNPPQGNWLGLFQKRKGLDEPSWVLIEMLRHTPVEYRQKFALGMISYLYFLEHQNTLTLEFESGEALLSTMDDNGFGLFDQAAS